MTRSAQELVSSIDISYSNQVRVHLTTWRGKTKIKFQPYSATVPQCFMPCGPRVAFPIEKLPDLIAALRKAEAQAVTLGLITERAQS